MKQNRKPFYKRWWFITLIAIIIIAAIVNPDEEENQDATKEEEVEEKNEETSQSEEVVEAENEELVEGEEEEVDAEPEDKSDKADDSKSVENEIDTSMYEFSKDVKVTDAIDINNYVSLMIEMNDELSPGLAFQHATTQTYDFLQQKALEGADQVGINILLDGQKIAMYEVEMSKFEINDKESMAQLVLHASVMEMITPEVHDYTQNMDLTYKEK